MDDVKIDYVFRLLYASWYRVAVMSVIATKKHTTAKGTERPKIVLQYYGAFVMVQYWINFNIIAT